MPNTIDPSADRNDCQTLCQSVFDVAGAVTEDAEPTEAFL
jgi:hypothetical protein